MPRKILALYDREKISDPSYTRIHEYAALPLNFMGMDVVYHLVTDPLPSDAEMEGVRGVFSWYRRFNAVSDPDAYCSWLTHQMKQGRKVVIWGEPGIFSNKKRRMSSACKQMFRTLGAEYLGGFSDSPYFWELVYKDPAMVEYERKINFTEGLQYSQYRVLSKESSVYLKIRRTDSSESTSDLVFITPRGGFVGNTFALYENLDIHKTDWRINPYLFLEKAFGLLGFPRPDVSTLNGRRVFYSQIDGDGIFNISHIDQESYSGEIVLKEILKKYADFPITASIITGYLDLPEFKSERATGLYKNIFSLPNIEAASHGYAHPLIWGDGTVAIDIPGYKYSARKEIAGSVGMLQKLLDDLHIEKKVKLFLWTGDAVPSAADIGLTYEAHVLNLNGGFDSLYAVKSSYAAYPTGILKGVFRQIYASDPNEYVYTDFWERNYYGFVDVLQTFRETESPRRLKPMDVYYHYYIGERAAGLKALTEIYNFVRSQKVFPVFASEYAQMAGDFFQTKIGSLAGGGFRISENGMMRTMRFDNEKRFVDLNRSRGVLGFDHFQGALYVFLDEALVHDLYLTPAKPSKPYVASAGINIRNFKGNSRHLRFAKKGWFDEEVKLGGMIPQKKYRVQSGQEEAVAASDKQGMLSIAFKSSEKNGPFISISIDAVP